MDINVIISKITKIGKDRFILLIIAGIACVLLSNNSVDIIHKQKENKQELSNERSNDETNFELNKQGNEFNKQGDEFNKQSKSDLCDASNKVGYSMTEYEQYYGKRLEDFLSQMYGAGRVKVLVFMKNSNELVVAKNCPYTRKNEEVKNGAESRNVIELNNEEDVVLYEGENGKKAPLILKEMAPQVGGIVVLAQGGDRKVIASEISGLLQALFGIDEHKIRVAKLRE